MANEGAVKGSRQRYGMLLLALGATFVFEGVAERAISSGRSGPSLSVPR
jgi:hypothetical protein